MRISCAIVWPPCMPRPVAGRSCAQVLGGPLEWRSRVRRRWSRPQDRGISACCGGPSCVGSGARDFSGSARVRQWKLRQLCTPASGGRLSNVEVCLRTRANVGNHLSSMHLVRDVFRRSLWLRAPLVLLTRLDASFGGYSGRVARCLGASVPACACSRMCCWCWADV